MAKPRLKRPLFRRNLLILLAMDAVLILVSYYAAYLVRFEFSIPYYMKEAFSSTWPWIIVVKLAVFWFFGLYRGMWRYTSIVDLINVLKAVLFSSLIVITIILMAHGFYGHPRSVFIIDMILSLLTISGIRVTIRLYYARKAGMRFFPGLHRPCSGDGRNLLVISDGATGDRVIREIQENPGLRMWPIGLLVDDARSQGKMLRGVPVLGYIADLSQISVHFDEILIALPGAAGEELRRIVNECDCTGKPYRTMPAMDELINGKVSVKAVRNVRVEDLLGREELHLDQDEIARYLKGKRVMVTGAGGSIGFELVRQIGRFAPESVALVEISEFNLFKVDLECRQRYPGMDIQPYLLDIRDRESVKRVFDLFKPQVVFHAAAYKHVPIQETFPWEAVHNNILGTWNLVRTSIENEIERFVLVSTDKAVRPTNVMGATKRVAEMLIECTNGAGPARFMAVRFGNVMGSSGSAIPVFREQISRGGPVTVTHPEITRFFMSVGEAAQLILQAGSLGNGGEIFLLEMGQPIRILDLVRDMIRLHGFEPESEIPITFTGLRPGEKLYEELITVGEGIVSTSHEKIMVLKGTACDYGFLLSQIESLIEAAKTFDAEAVRAKLKEMVAEYDPTPNHDKE